MSKVVCLRVNVFVLVLNIDMVNTIFYHLISGVFGSITNEARTFRV